VGYYEAEILPRLLDVACGSRQLDALRARNAAGLSGEVLELGFGSGRNVPFYPPEVRRVLAVDPAVTGRRLAAARVAASPVVVDFVGLDGQRLPLSDASVDDALSTWTLCTIPDVRRALAELHRVLRPGGTFHFLEHGRAPDASVVRWQRRLAPLNSLVFGGCHLDRPIDRLVADAGFAVTGLRRYYVRGLKSTSYMYEGVATPR
jgi:ubiquinone/menaquinone biosynthesis C-methylase UbiE